MRACVRENTVPVRAAEANLTGMKGIKIYSFKATSFFTSEEGLIVLLRIFPFFIRAMLALCVVVLTVTTAHAENAEKVRQEIFSLAENWNENQESIIEYLNDTDPLRRMYAVDAIPLSDT